MCMTPLTVRNSKTGAMIEVPCSKCPDCKARRASWWSFRLMIEERNCNSAHFITLTYDTETVPITRNGFKSVDKRHVQLFFKRLRKRNPVGIKYYLAAEYGSSTSRPHYHVILFNCSESSIGEAWIYGNVWFGTVTGASVGYTLKYICKQGRIPMHINDDRVPEFGLMSKGLGKSYLTDAMLQWHANDLYNRMYCNLLDGRKISMPRYFRSKIYTEAEQAEISERNRCRYLELQQEAIKDNPDYFRDRNEGVYAAFRDSVRKEKEGGKL